MLILILNRSRWIEKVNISSEGASRLIKVDPKILVWTGWNGLGASNHKQMATLIRNNGK